MIYKLVVDEFGILPGNQQNFNKINYCMGMAQEDWVISADILQKVYSKCPDN